jgi:hypothetical protein
VFVKGSPAPDLMIAELKRGARMRQERAEALFPLFKRHRADGFAIEMEEIEQEEDQSIAVTSVRCVLDQVERGRAVGPDATELAIEIGLPGKR